MEILHGNLAGGTAGAVAVTAGLGFAPAKRMELNLAFVLVIRRFTVNSVNLEIIINSRHRKPP